MTFKLFIESEQIQDFNSYIEKFPVLKAGIEVLRILEKYGEAYIVGGAVRDIIIGNKAPDDIDITTNVPMEKIEELFDSHDIGKNKDFGVIVIKYEGHEFEIANYRTDIYSTLDGKGASTVKISSSFKDDAARRDLKINALAIDSKGNIIDHFEGMKAIKNKIISTVGDPSARFKEDKVRMLRAVRFASRLGFKIDPKTADAIRTQSGEISDVAAERITKELLKMAETDGGTFADAIQTLDDVGLLKHILPEVLKMKEFLHSIDFHPEGKTVWDHVMAALRANKLTSPIINLAVLFHDIGKISTYKLTDEGKHSYIGHAKVGVDLINKIADRLKLDNETRNALIFAAEHHMKMHDFLNMSNSKIAKLISDDNWDVLFNVALVDDKSRLHLYDEEHWKKITKAIEALTIKYQNKEAKEAIRKLVNGGTVMKLRGIKPGPMVGKVINATVDWILDNDIDLSNTQKINDHIKSVEVD